jgi:hypothetical protein
VKLLDALRNRRSRASGHGDDATTGSPGDSQLPMPDYDRLDDQEIAGRLSQLSQVQLAAVEAYERAHGARPVVLDKLRYMRGSEPLPGYDALTTVQIVEALAGADTETVKAVRDYERKFQHRPAVLKEAARVLPGSRASAAEVRARDGKAALLREGYADRERTTRDLPG